MAPFGYRLIWRILCTFTLMFLWTTTTSGVGPCDGETICEEGTVCKEVGDSYSCECKPGYEKKFRDDNGYILCKEKDECEDVSICLSDETCTNTVGSYRCGCAAGYRRQKGGCKDIDECESPVATCGSGTCNNTIGAFVCLCLDGTSTTGKPCADSLNWTFIVSTVVPIVVMCTIVVFAIGLIQRRRVKRFHQREPNPIFIIDENISKDAGNEWTIQTNVEHLTEGEYSEVRPKLKKKYSLENEPQAGETVYSVATLY